MPDTQGFTVEMGEEEYSLVAPDGTPGFPVPYGEATATIMWNGVLYYAHVDDPEEFPEDSSESPTVFRVDSMTVVESEMQEVSDEEEEDEEEDEDEDEIEREPVPGEVVEFPAPDEEEEDEDLPPAE